MTEYLKNRSIIGIFTATVFVFANITAFFPVLPIYLKSLHASNLEIGAVMSAFPVGVLLFRPAVSWLLTQQGRRWNLMFGALSLSISSLFYLISKEISVIFLVRLVHGIGVASFTTTSSVLIADLTKPENRGQLMGFLSVANFTGFGVGPIIASQLFQAFNVATVFAIATIFALIGMLTLFLIQEPAQQVSELQTTISVQHILWQRRVLVPALFFFSIALGQGSVVTFLPLFLQTRGAFDPGLFFVYFALAAFFSRILIGKAADTFHRGILILTTTIIVLLAFRILSQTHSALELLLAGMLYGVGYGSLHPTLTALVADSSTFQTRGYIFSLYYASFDTGMLTAGYLFGFLADEFSIGVIYPVAMVLVGTGLVFFITQIRTPVKNSISWAFRLRPASGKVCPRCNNAIGVDPCDACGSRVLKNKPVPLGQVKSDS